MSSSPSLQVAADGFSTFRPILVVVTVVAEILQLGDPRLRVEALPVENLGALQFRQDAARLETTLAAFRAEQGFGRAIAATQIGIERRLLALELGNGPELMIHPENTWRSTDTFTLWDDCTNFPSLLVKVRWHTSISVAFLDRKGTPRKWERLDRSVSELLQHEIDYLDGILAVDRDSLVLRNVFERDRGLFLAQVDGVSRGV